MRRWSDGQGRELEHRRRASSRGAKLVQMARDGAADVALLQEAGSPPGDVVDRIEYVDGVFWNRHLYDRWPLVVKLSDRITVEPYRQVPPTSDLGEEALGVSGIGTIAAARVTPRDNADASFVAVSLYARWLKPHPSTKRSWRVGIRGCLRTSDPRGAVAVVRSRAARVRQSAPP